jgi:hypothetical protein
VPVVELLEINEVSVLVTISDVVSASLVVDVNISVVGIVLLISVDVVALQTAYPHMRST